MTLVLKISILLIIASFYAFLKTDEDYIGIVGVTLILPFSIGLTMFVIEGFRLIVVSLGWL